MAKESKAIEKHESNSAIVSTVPDYLQREQGVPAAGLENMEQKDFTLPRLSICQAGSPQRKKSEPKYIPGLSDGDIFNSVTGEVYETVRIIPLFFFKSNILFMDMELGGGILCQAPDGKHGVGEPGGDCVACPKSRFTQNGGKGIPPECNGFFNYAVLVVPESGSIGVNSLAILSLKSTGLKAAKDWNAIMRMKGTDSFASSYIVSTAEQKNNSGQTWFVPVIKEGGWITKDQLPIVRGAYEAIRALQNDGKLRIEVEEMSDLRQPGDEMPD